MADFDQVVVGVGTSGLTFLHGALNGQNKLFSVDKTLVVGEGELWSKVNQASSVQHSGGANLHPPNEMGQPVDLLAPINKTQNPTGGLNNIKVNQYVQGLATLKADVQQGYVSANKQLHFRNSKVQKVTRIGLNAFEVKIADADKAVTAKQVIIASGTGPAQTPQSAVGDKSLIEGEELLKTQPRMYREILSGDEYLATTPDNLNKSVLVHGSSPTSAWAVAHAIYLRAKRICWLARTNFNEANPAGRNSPVILMASESGMMTVGAVKKIKVVDAADGKPRLAVQLIGSKGAKAPVLPLDASFDTHEPRGVDVLGEDFDNVVYFDQYVYCFGFDPTGPGGPASILDNGSILEKLEPVYDTDKRFGAKPDETVIAYATPDKDLWVVGAAVFRNMGQSGLKACAAKYKRIPDMLCLAGTPPEGIAAVKADIKAVTKLPSDAATLNWNLADRQEFGAFLQKRYAINLMTQPKPDSVGNALKIADKIIERRKKTVFGWKAAIFNVVVVECAAEVLNKMLDLPYPTQKFNWNDAGIDDMASFLRERFYPTFNDAKSDQVAKEMILDRRKKNERWNQQAFNKNIKDYSAKAGIPIQVDAIR